MSRIVANFLFFSLLLAPGWAVGDSWIPPETQVILSANGQFRVTVTPGALGGPLGYSGGMEDCAKPGHQREAETRLSPIARVEQLENSDDWRLVWQMPLVNDVAPASVLLSNDASFLVTFDNWASLGYGDDVVVIYDQEGRLVQKLSLEQVLPTAYVHHVPRSVSSRWWGGEHTLVDGDSHVELQVVQPGGRIRSTTDHVSVRIRLTDGEVLQPSGHAWEQAMAKAISLEEQRLEAWEDMRRFRTAPLVPPTSNDSSEWQRYLFELRDRISAEDEIMRGLVLGAPGEDQRRHTTEMISKWIELYDDENKWAGRSFIVVSPTSDRLAALLAESFLARAEGSMRRAHVVFVGTLAEGDSVIEAAKQSGAKISVVDRTVPFPPGEPLPQTPPPLWTPAPVRF